MHIFDYKKYKEHTWDNEIISYVSQIHEYRGKQDLYIRQKPVELDRLIEIAKIQSTESYRNQGNASFTDDRYARHGSQGKERF